MMSWLTSLLHNRKALMGGMILSAFILIALVGPYFVSDPSELTSRPHLPPSWEHPCGTTGQGQDVLAQTVCGARVTLTVGFIVGILVTLIGALIGTSAAYLGGRIDDSLSLLTNVFLVIPGLPLAIVLAAYLPPGPVGMTVVLVIAGWAWNARVFRAQALSLVKKDFIAAAIVSGESHLRVIAIEILPNMASLVVSALIGATIYAIGAQVGLEFLGLGDVRTVSWGTNLFWASNDSALLTGSWWIFLPTGLCVALVGFSLSLLNFAVDEVTNPSLHHPPLKESSPPQPMTSEKLRSGYHEKTKALLSLEQLTVSYPGDRVAQIALKDVSLSIRDSEIFGLAGESGCGKSTIGQAILRILSPAAQIQRGAILFEGKDLLKLDEKELQALRWSEISMVFQSAINALNPVMKVGDQIIDAIQAHQPLTTSAARERATKLLEMVDIDPRAVTAYPHTLSGGMRQRVVIAMALALEPRLIIMDEPTTALDVVVQQEILQRMLELKASLGFSVLFITHDLPLMLELADRIAVLYNGHLVELGLVDTLRNEARHPYTQKLLNSFPALDAPRKELINSEPPLNLSAKRLNSGCCYRAVCPVAMKVCAESSPELKTLDTDHQAACFRGRP